MAEAIREQLLTALRCHESGDLTQAESLYLQVLEQQPHQPDALHLLGVVRHQQGADPVARALIEQAIQVQPAPLYYLNLGVVQEALGCLTGAAEAYRQVLSLQEDTPTASLGLARVLQDQNQIEAALDILNALLERHPQDLQARLARDLMLPVFYTDTQEIWRFRQRFRVRLEQLCQDLRLEDPTTLALALQAIRAYPNFYLAYQGQLDLDLQRQFGDLVHRIMVKMFPDWAVPPPPLPPDPERRIRIGYVSAYMGNHTVGKLTLGWLRHHDPQVFEIYSYHVGQIWDRWTEAFQQHSDRFYYLPGQLETACDQIRSDRLQVLVFLDIGMHALPGMMAALRLAPVQCTTWTHPVTTGIPTVDYFLSSDRMEPPGAESHYSETLVRLPHLSIAYSQPPLPTPRYRRADLALPEDRILYLCCQSLFKYLPQYDYIWAEIARQVPEALFVFLSYRREGGERVDEQLRSRLQIAFQQLGLESHRHTQVIPRLSWSEYLQLNQISDIYLDSLGWSGGNTTLEAVACGLPIVTCPGSLMRGRHSAAILQQLGISETIAADESDYIRIAVALGQDPDYRQQISHRVLAARHRVFEDPTPVRALESFYRECVARERD